LEVSDVSLTIAFASKSPVKDFLGDKILKLYKNNPTVAVKLNMK
jgi:ABC-type molybdate transport system ATPase subunit